MNLDVENKQKYTLKLKSFLQDDNHTVSSDVMCYLFCWMAPKHGHSHSHSHKKDWKALNCAIRLYNYAVRDSAFPWAFHFQYIFSIIRGIFGGNVIFVLILWGIVYYLQSVTFNLTYVIVNYDNQLYKLKKLLKHYINYSKKITFLIPVYH